MLNDRSDRGFVIMADDGLRRGAPFPMPQQGIFNKYLKIGMQRVNFLQAWRVTA